MLVILQVAGFLNSSRRLERQVSGKVQVPSRAARNVVTVSRQNRALALHRPRTPRLVLQHVHPPAILQIHLLPFLMVMGQRALQPSYRLEGALKRFQTPGQFLIVGNSCASHAPLPSVPLRSHGIHAAHRRALARVLRIFRNIQVRG